MERAEVVEDCNLPERPHFTLGVLEQPPERAGEDAQIVSAWIRVVGLSNGSAAAMTSESGRNASAGSAWRGARGRPKAASRTIQCASMSATAPDASTSSSSPPPWLAHSEIELAGAAS
eukprot:scaffold217355_cov32-Tisochrysis_lutea.AAC.4